MELKKKVPEVRFKGFSGEWEEQELGKLFDITSASRVHKNEWTESGIPFFRSSDVVADYKGQENIKAFISYELYKELSSKTGCVQKNDILVTGGGSIGIPYLVKNDEPLYFKDADLLWLKNGNIINGNFLYTFFSTLGFRRYVNSITHIGTISHYTVEQAKLTPFKVPVRAEQDKIGDYLLKLDQLITLHQKKYNKLTNIKKAMLEKMFPKNGADVPEIRFEGFEGKWEEREVNDIADRYDNLRVPITSTNRIPGNTPYYGANGIQDYVKGYTHNGDFILIAEDGANDLKNYPVQYVKGQIWVNNHAHVLQAKMQIADNKFLKYAFSQISFEPILVGGGRAKLNAQTMMKIKISFSLDIKEQQKIGTYFQKLDQLITLQQTQIEKLKNLKKACLEKMFV